MIVNQGLIFLFLKFVLNHTLEVLYFLSFWVYLKLNFELSDQNQLIATISVFQSLTMLRAVGFRNSFLACASSINKTHVYYYLIAQLPLMLLTAFVYILLKTFGILGYADLWIVILPAALMYAHFQIWEFLLLQMGKNKIKMFISLSKLGTIIAILLMAYSQFFTLSPKLFIVIFVYGHGLFSAIGLIILLWWIKMNGHCGFEKQKFFEFIKLGYNSSFTQSFTHFVSYIDKAIIHSLGIADFNLADLAFAQRVAASQFNILKSYCQRVIFATELREGLDLSKIVLVISIGYITLLVAISEILDFKSDLLIYLLILSFLLPVPLIFVNIQKNVLQVKDWVFFNIHAGSAFILKSLAIAAMSLHGDAKLYLALIIIAEYLSLGLSFYFFTKKNVAFRTKSN